MRRHAWGYGPGGAGGPRGRRRRGDVRAAILLLLDEEPRNGYGLIQEVERRSEGAWRPSPGSIYPTLAQLDDEGLVEQTGDKTFALTDAGRAYVAENREQLGEPWNPETPGHEAFHDLRRTMGQVGMAAMQVAQTGDALLVAQARDILTDARRSLYRLLADDGEDD